MDVNVAAVLFNSVYVFTLGCMPLKSSPVKQRVLVFGHFYLEMAKFKVNICTSMQANQASLSSGKAGALRKV